MKRATSWVALFVVVLIGLSLVIAVTLVAGRPCRADAGVIYVDTNAPGPTNDGLSWTTAFTEVQAALAAAGAGDEIWVSAGVYYPDFVPASGQYSGNPGATFQLKQGVALYGGFAATETLRSQRDWLAHVTVLSGDLGRDDGVDADGVVTDTAQISGTNAYRVLTSSSVTESAVLDGFAVTAACHYQGEGGGMYNTSSSPTLAHVLFRGNLAGYGGGMYNRYSSPSLTDVTFRDNACSWGGHWGYGGGMYNYSSDPTLTHVAFVENWVSQDGGAMNNNGSSPTLIDVVFEGNSANGGAGLFNINGSSPSLTDVLFLGNRANGGGAIYNYMDCSPTLVNVVFSGNSAVYSYAAGAMHNQNRCSPTLINVTFAGNLGALSGLANTENSHPTLANGILWGAGTQISNDATSTATVTYSDIQGGYPGVGNVDADPLFVDADGPDGIAGTADDDLHLRRASPAIDAGDNSAVPPTLTADLDGRPRLVDVPSVPDSGSGAPPVVDMGAYEARFWVSYLPVILR